MRLIQTRHLLKNATMALHSAPSAKLIFAPSGSDPSSTQAAQFTLSQLSKSDLHPTSPIPQFHKWFQEAQQSGSISHPEACALSTAELPSGRVSSRMVYLKELEAGADTTKGEKGDGGWVIYSNWGTSRKAADINTNPHACLLFHWEALQRQVRIEGTTERLSSSESQNYFDTRVRGSRIGAWASQQSRTLKPEGPEDDGRKQLEGWVRDVENKFDGQEEIPVPEFWGGLRVKAERVEFWQGRESRLHDRFVYVREGNEWKIERLSP